MQEKRETSLFPTEPPAAVTDLLMRWGGLVEESGGTIQQPEPRGLRAFYGLFGSSLIGRNDVAAAARHATLLAALVARAVADVGIEAEVRAGLVVRNFDPRADASAELADSDADLAYLLALRAPPNTLLTDSHAAFALRPGAHMEPVESIVGPGLAAPVPAWRLVSLGD